MKKIGFVILNYNGAPLTCSLADSVLLWNSENLENHIVIVDNCSKDDSYTVLSEKYTGKPGVDVLLAEKNGGYSYGNNLGAKYAAEKYGVDFIAIANPDIQIDQESFEKLLQAFETHPELIMAAPVMKSLDGSYRIRPIMVPTYWDDLRACFTEKERKGETVEPIYLDEEKKLLQVQMLPGSFFVIRAKEFAELGYFDENVFLFCEERILGHKLLERGMKAAICTDLFFVHAHSAIIGKNIKIIHTWETMLRSRYYYNETYRNLNGFQKLLLKAGMKYYLAHLRLILWAGPIARKIKGK